MTGARDRPIPNMALRRRRDDQQWILDWMVKTAGRDRQFFYDGRTLPASVRSYAMIPREMEKEARHKETLAKAAEERGHYLTACELYQKAVADYHGALHPLPYEGNQESAYPRFHAVADWLLDVLEGRKPPHFDRKVMLHPNRGRGPYSADAPGFFLPERLQVE